MPNYQRPPLPYVSVPLNFNDRYKQLGNNGVPSFYLDGENNYIIDSINQLDVKIDNTAAGILPGANVPTNANKLVTTDGNGNISFVSLTGLNVQDNSIPATKLLASSITSLQLGNGVVNTNNINQQAITQSLMADNSIGTNQIIGNSVTYDAILPGSVKGSNAVTASIIGYQSIGTTDIGNGVITQAQMANNSIGNTQLQANSVSLTQLTAGLQAYFPPAGTVINFAGTTFIGAGSIWFECLGQLVSRTTYPTLFANIGTIFGAGDGSTTFALPNLPGRTIVGISSTGSTNGLVTSATAPIRALGATFGEETHTLDIDEMPSHNHAINYGDYASTGYPTQSSYSKQVNSGTFNTQSSGGDGAHNNMQPSIFMRNYIKMF